MIGCGAIPEAAHDRERAPGVSRSGVKSSSAHPLLALQNGRMVASRTKSPESSGCPARAARAKLPIQPLDRQGIARLRGSRLCSPCPRSLPSNGSRKRRLPDGPCRPGPHPAREKPGLRHFPRPQSNLYSCATAMRAPNQTRCPSLRKTSNHSTKSGGQAASKTSPDGSSSFEAWSATRVISSSCPPPWN